MTGRLSGIRAIITGAAGGIGAAAARAFVHEGAVVGLLDLPSTALDALAVELGSAAQALRADVSDEASVQDTIARWRVEHGGLDVVYTCAGVQLHDEDSPVHRLSLATWNRTFAINATGTFLIVKHCIALLQESTHASIILCGSPTGLTMSGQGYAAYSASKGAVISLSRQLAADYATAGIRANCIIPGTVATPLIEQLVADPAINRQLVAGTPLGRLGTPDDLAGLAVFLASPESSFSTGSTYTVDGGLTVR